MQAGLEDGDAPVKSGIVDTDEILGDLRLAVGYAAQAGLLRDRNILDVVKATDAAMRGPAQSSPDMNMLALSLSDLAQAIAPISTADLKYGRDPFSPANQRRSKAWQLGLSLFALVMLVIIGYFMHALQLEQSAIVALNEIEQMQPQMKLTSLRKMAQYDKPMMRESPLYEQFHQKVEELRRVNAKLYATYTDASDAARLPLFPLGQYVGKSVTTTPAAPLLGNARNNAQAADTVTLAGPGITNASGGRISNQTTGGTSPATVAAPESGGPDQPQLPLASEDQFCVEESNGQIRLPPQAANLPPWIREVLRDSLGDFCFQLKVLSPGGDGALLNSVMTHGFVSPIRNKIELRVEWFLPFLFGLLGATIYMMRNVASVRTPAMEAFPMIMRLSLGGVAGIVIGWFATGATPGTEITRTISLPFALAFLVGYGIDALFNLLDRLNRTIAEPIKRA